MCSTWPVAGSAPRFGVSLLIWTAGVRGRSDFRTAHLSISSTRLPAEGLARSRLCLRDQRLEGRIRSQQLVDQAVIFCGVQGLDRQESLIGHLHDYRIPRV